MGTLDATRRCALEDDALLLLIRQELAKRCQKSKTRGRQATPAEVVLRMLLLKHVHDWSYETLTRELRANLFSCEIARRVSSRLRARRATISVRCLTRNWNNEPRA
jgi:hypothetical protein